MLDKNTSQGRALRTLIQNSAALVLIVVPALLASDDFRNWVASSDWAWLLVVLPIAGSVASYIQNYFDTSVPNFSAK